MDAYSRYVRRVARILQDIRRSGRPTAVYIPPSIDQAMLLDMCRLEYVDFRDLLYRYPARYLDGISRYVSRMYGGGVHIYIYSEAIPMYYPRSRDAYYEMISSMDGGVAICYSDRQYYDEAISRYGLRGVEIVEASLSDIWVSKLDSIIYTEGSPTFRPGARDRHIEYLNRYMLRDGNERYIIYYLVRYRGVGRLARILGPELGTYLNRLVRRGIVCRVGGRRGVYMVRDPMLRYSLASLSGLDWRRYLGYIYLIRKLLEGVREGVEVVSPYRDITVGEAEKFQYIDEYTLYMRDIDRVYYVFRIHRGFRSDVEALSRFRRAYRIVVLPTLEEATAKRLYREGIYPIDVAELNRVASITGFPRPI